MGARYDRRRGVHISLWRELAERPPLLGLEEVIERLQCYGIEVAVDGQRERWLARQRNWCDHQMAALSRWVAVDPSRDSKGEDVDLDEAA